MLMLQLIAHKVPALRRVVACLATCALLAACSFRQMAVDILADALAEGGGVYASEEDPQLVYEAIPFGIKTYESLLQASPRNRQLLLAAAKGFAGYAYLTREKADQMAAEDLEDSRRQRLRASRLFLRARDFAKTALEIRHPDLFERLSSEGEGALDDTGKDDVECLYWAGAAWAGAISTAKGDLGRIAELPLAEALVRRVLVLDATFDDGAAHEFFISFEGGRPGGSAEAARRHYRLALDLSGGLRGSVHLALAETVLVAEQDLAGFRRLLDAARSVDADAAPELRLVNAISGQRADWLETQIPELFLEANLAETSQ